MERQTNNNAPCNPTLIKFERIILACRKLLYLDLALEGVARSAATHIGENDRHQFF